MNKRKQHRRGQRRGKFRSCKYCYNAPKRHQGLCGVCAERTKEENQLRYKILVGYETLMGFLEQSNISENNIKTIESFLDTSDAAAAASGSTASEQSGSLDSSLAAARSTFFDFATIVLEISHNFPRKKRRIQRVKDARPELYDRMRRQDYFDWYFDEYEACGFGGESE